MESEKKRMGRQRRRRICLWVSLLNCYGKSIGGKSTEEDDGNAEVALQLCQLPEDFIFYILMKIPSKYILELRCVCKAWYALISDSTFTNSFLGGPLRDDNNSYSFFIYCQDYGKFGYYPITLSTFHLDHHNRHKTNLLERTTKSDCSVFLLPYSVNGLVCLIGEKYFYICNPTTEQFRTFPIKNTVVSNFGFGYDKSKNVYKLVQVFSEDKIDWLSSYNSIRFAVLTISGTSSTKTAWKPIKAPECTIEGGWPPILIFVDGAMYMFSNKTVRVHSLGVLKFDIQDEKFESLNVPLEIENAYLDYISMVEMEERLFMVELQGRLCIVNKIFDHEILRRMDLWILKDPANRDWIQRRIVMDSDRGESFHMLIQPQCIIHERKIVFSTANGLVSYDTENKVLETLYSDETKAYHFSCTTYVPSLVSLNMS